MRAPRFTLLAAIISGALFAVSCAAPSTTRTPTSSPPPTIQGLAATLEDEVRDADGGRIRWSTYWKLCWDEYPGALSYELQAATSEGASPKLRAESGRCFRIEVAAGVNDKSQGLLNREQLVSLQTGQLTYRVRAVLNEGRRSEWSPAMEIGRVVVVPPKNDRRD